MNATLAPPSAAPVAAQALLDAQIDAACTLACAAIAPSWPLDRAIAVNPHWGRIGRPVLEVAARMAVLADIQVLPPRPQVRTAWQRGRITEADLRFALAAQDPQAPPVTRAQCLQALEQAAGIARLPLLIDVLDDDPQRGRRLSWRQAITHQISQTCAAYFDENQADWPVQRGQGLYAFWRDTLTHDHGIGLLMGLPRLGQSLHALPASARDAERWALQLLGLPASAWSDYLESVLLSVQGWASWCAYLGWQAQLEQRTDQHLRELLAVRLAWGAVLVHSKDSQATQRALGAVQAAWSRAHEAIAQAQQALAPDAVWQRALEAHYQQTLAQQLQRAQQASAPVRHSVEAQLAFCIDVRSEPMRRALEATSPALQTLGFAGFFGLPMAYTPMGTTARRPQLPGLLAPAVEAVERVLPAGAADEREHLALTEQATQARQQRFAWTQTWRDASRWPGAAYAFVEAAGLGYLGAMTSWLHPRAQARAQDDHAGLPPRYRALCRPMLAMELPHKIALAQRVLHAMGLEPPLAPLVVLVGHGAQTANNAQAAALDCGACCGQTGEMNARTLARLLNEPAVRAGLRERGVNLADSTTFVAALHNTTTDEIEGFDLDLLGDGARQRWQQLQPLLELASAQVRRERAPRLGLPDTLDNDSLLQRLRQRASDGAQTRPEWGLAGNAAFIMAPRQRTLGAVLDGRSFLHDYHAEQDADGSVLELLMTAPMLVTHWINWQYHASTCDPERLGSGNKVLHNVVAGQVGVFEGNGGDLRIGLARQSLHDGTRWMHEPLRLTVVIDAPVARIEAIIGRHPVVRQLIDNGWLHLWRMDGPTLLRRERGQWLPLDREA